jgi:hypothetical protein
MTEYDVPVESENPTSFLPLNRLVEVNETEVPLCLKIRFLVAK